MAVTKVPFKAKYGLQSFEDSTFSKAVSVSGALSVTGNSTFTNNLTLTNGQLYQGGTAFMTIPKGNTAQRTGSPQVGAFRANTETNNFEGYIDGSWVILGGTTSLKTAAYQNMELIKSGIGHELIAGNAGVRMYRDVFCINYNPGGVTGTMVFFLPAGADLNNTMMRFKITGFQYDTGTPWEVDIGGYWYANNSSWNSCRAVVKGSAPFNTIRCGVHTATGKLALIIGSESTVWSYPKAVVTNFMASYGGVDRDWSAGWDGGIGFADATMSKLVTCPTEWVYTTSNFDPSTKFDKAGGSISGAVTMGSTLYVSGAGTIVGQLSLPAGAYATAAMVAVPTSSQSGSFVAAGNPSQGAFQCQVSNTGGGFAAWNTSRIAALQVDAPSASSAYMVARATQWGVRHLGAIEMYAGGTTSSTCTIVFHVQSAQNAFTFDGGGNFTALGNVTAYSDRRLKKDLERIENALDKIDQLTGYTYVRTDIQVEHEVRQTGLIAQDVQKVLPEAVTVSDNEMQTLGVSYGNMMGLVVEAIKELRAELNELKRGA